MSPNPAPSTALASLLPQPLPAPPADRLFLYVFRRLAAHGLHDAAAAQAMLGAFSAGFQRPLIAVRALVADLCAAAAGPIQVAPCCCCRMTGSEAALMAVIGRAERQPETAALLLADLVSRRHADGVLATATLVAAAFADAGHPIGT